MVIRVMPRFVCLLALVSCLTARSQGTVLFRADLSGSQAIPANQSPRTATADFSLEPNGTLYGAITFHQPINVTGASIFFSDSLAEVGALMYGFVQEPPPMNGYVFGRALSNLDHDFLMQGKWYVNV